MRRFTGTFWQSTRRRLPQWWVPALVLVTLCAIYLLVRDAIRLDRALAPASGERLLTAHALASVQGHIQQATFELRRDGRATPLAVVHYGNARAALASLPIEAPQAAISPALSPQTEQLLQALQADLATTDQLMVAYSRANSAADAERLRRRLDIALSGLQLRLMDLYLAQERDTRAAVATAQAVGRPSRLTLVLASTTLAATCCLLLLATRQRLYVEQHASERFALAASAADGAIYDWDVVNNLLRWTDGLAETFGYQMGEVPPKVEWWESQIHPDDRRRVTDALNQAIMSGRDFTDEYRFRHADGRYLTVWDRGRAVRDRRGRVVRLVGMVADVSEQRRAEAALHESERKYSELVQEAPDAIVSLDRAGRFQFFNPAAERLFDRAAADVVGKHYRELALIAPHDLPQFEQETAVVLAGEARPPFEVDLARGEAEARTIEVSLRAQSHGGGGGTIQFTLRDISDRKAIEAQLARQALRDPVTELPNRALFLDRLSQALARARQRQLTLAVLYVDLDRFKIINDSLGHGPGDRLLAGMGLRLQTCVRPEDTVARLGGDEFALLVESVKDATEAAHVAERVATALRAPFRIEGRDLYVTASIGIVLSAATLPAPDDLLHAAEVAMYRAKTRGKGLHEIYDTSMNADALAQLELETDLRQALKRGEFRVFYQPLVRVPRPGSADIAEIVGLEALLRWQHPTRGLIQPAQFIPLVEETGMILPLGHWVLTEACRQVLFWQQVYKAHGLELSVNLSAWQFQQPNLDREISRVLRETGLPPGSLKLEITESVMMADAGAAHATLTELKRLGVKVAIDDFGTGYSSLSYLKRFPIDALKIDRSFVQGLPDDSGDVAIVLAMITLAQTLGLQVIAEGVESAAQQSLLRDLGCHIVQGYHFASPLPQEAIHQLITRQCQGESPWEAGA